MAGLMRRAGVDKKSVIRVIGPNGLATLLWLCRHGYEQVGYVRQGPCPAETCDLLVVLQEGEANALATTLERGPHLRDGGILVLQTPEHGRDAPDLVDGVLDRCGYRVEMRLHGCRRELHLARREGPPMRKAA